jgi:hypothetical protein
MMRIFSGATAWVSRKFTLLAMVADFPDPGQAVTSMFLEMSSVMIFFCSGVAYELMGFV